MESRLSTNATLLKQLRTNIAKVAPKILPNISDPKQELVELFNPETVVESLQAVGGIISNYDPFADENPIFIPLAKGGLQSFSYMFNSLGNQFMPMLEVAYVSSYKGGMNSQELEWKYMPNGHFTDKQMLLWDDVIDTKKTLALTKEFYEKQGAHVFVGTMLYKHRETEYKLEPDFVSLHCNDLFTLGMGLDLANLCRNWKGIHGIKQQNDVVEKWIDPAVIEYWTKNNFFQQNHKQLIDNNIVENSEVRKLQISR